MKESRKRKKWNPADMAEACAALKSGQMGYLKASKRFNVPRSTLERYVKKSKSFDEPVEQGSVEPSKLSDPCTISDSENMKATPKRKTWSVANMKKAYAALKSGRMGYKKASNHFNVPRTTLGNYVNSSKSFDELVNTRLGRKRIFDAKVEQILVDCCIKMANKTCYALRKTDIRTLAFQLAQKYDIRNPFRDNKGEAGHKWLYSFLKRHPQLYSIPSLSIPGPWPKKRTFLGSSIEAVASATSLKQESDSPIPSTSAVHLTVSPSVHFTSTLPGMSSRSTPSATDSKGKTHLDENLRAVTSFSKLSSLASKQSSVETLFQKANNAVSSKKLAIKKENSREPKSEVLAPSTRCIALKCEPVFPRKQALKRERILPEVSTSSALFTSASSTPEKSDSVSVRAKAIKKLNTMQLKPETLVPRARGRPRKSLAAPLKKQAILKGNGTRSMSDILDSPSLYKTTRIVPKMSDSVLPTKQPIIKANVTRTNPTTLISSPLFKNADTTPKRNVPVSSKNQVIKTKNSTRSKSELFTPLSLNKTSRSTPKKTVLTKKQTIEMANRRQTKSEVFASSTHNTRKKTAPVVPRVQTTKTTNRQQSKVEVLTLSKLPGSGTIKTSKKSPMQIREKEKERQVSKKQKVSKQETEFQAKNKASKKREISKPKTTVRRIEQIGKKQKVIKQETKIQEMEASMNEHVIFEMKTEELEQAGHEEEYIVPEPHFEMVLVDYPDIIEMDDLNNGLYGWSHEECVVETNIDEYY